MRRIAHVDGLRALAAFSVLAFHLGVPAFSGGFVGVDIFFVISGFLITGMIVRQVDRGQFTFSAFYARRVQRLAPALFAVILCSGVAASVLMTPQHLKEFGVSAIASVLALSNITFSQQAADYFAIESHAKPLLHTWTLSAEWQFYFVWPAFLVVVMFIRRALLLPVVAGVALVSLAANVVWAADPSTVFYRMPFRIFEFAIGALLLWAPPVRHRLIREGLCLLGLALIGYAILTYDGSTVFPGMNALAPALGAALAIYAARGTTTGRLIDNRAAAYLGSISYSVYLVHWPLIVFTAYALFRPLAVGEAAIVGALSVVLGAALFHALEYPFWKGRFSKMRLTPAFAATALVLVAISTSASRHGWPGRLDSKAVALANDAGEFQKQHFGGAGFPVNEVAPIGSGKPQVILAGDSHAGHFASGLADALSRAGAGGWLLFDHGCVIAPGLTRHGTTENDAKQCAGEFSKLKAVAQGNSLPLVLAYSWSGYQGQLTPAVGASPLTFSSTAAYAAFLFSKLDELRAAVGRRQVVLVGTVPGSGDAQAAIDCLLRPAESRNGCEEKLTIAEPRANGFEMNGLLRAYAARTGAAYVDPYSVFCRDGSCGAFVGGKLAYSDRGHLSKDGSAAIAPSILKAAFSQMGAGPAAGALPPPSSAGFAAGR